ncbi:ppsA [Symbiodinium sp. CCMP2592]|nr:ppsA [Symbiodinium sp. CCMP2592]
MVECHGTGTALGDPIEAGALAAVLGTSKAEDPLWLAAGKTNLGHLEAAAGFAGAAKVIACLNNGKVPANLHFAELNPHIELVGLAIPTQATQLAASPNEKLLSGLSSFGFGGSNAHVLLAQPEDACRRKGASSGRGHRVLVSAPKVAMLFTGQSRLRRPSQVKPCRALPIAAVSPRCCSAWKTLFIVVSSLPPVTPPPQWS